jgi:hypothetical protein
MTLTSSVYEPRHEEMIGPRQRTPILGLAEKTGRIAGKNGQKPELINP